MKKRHLLWIITPLCVTDVSAYEGSTRLFSEQDLQKSFNTLRVMKNDIFARHGYKFNDPEWQLYYDRQEWYKEAANNDAIKLNDIEQKNITLLNEALENIKEQQKTIAALLAQWKKTDIRQLEKELKIAFDNDYAKQYFQQLLQKIELNAVEKTGFSQITVDNGEEKIQYQAKIQDNQLILGFNRSLSELDDPTKTSELYEWATYWFFKLDNGKLVLIKTEVAG